MKKQYILAVSLFFLFSLMIAPYSNAQNDTPPRRIVGYFISWGIYGANYHVPQIPADRLTHINYAFINISEEGECILGDPWAEVEYPYPGAPEDAELLGNFGALQQLKAQYPHLKVLLSVGGWTWSGRFSDVALTEDSREKFARSCVAMMAEYGFDGLDIDWEYPVSGGLEGNITRPEDRENYTLLLAELRRQLDALGEETGEHYLLTIAAPAGRQYLNYELDRIHEYLDWLNLMAYDYNGGWSERTGFNAPLYSDNGQPSVDQSVQNYLAAGVPADKLVLGVPFYGRGWKGVPAENNGLYQPYTELPNPDLGGYFSYRILAQIYERISDRYWHDVAQVPWLYIPETETMISYDDPQSLRLKAAYVKEQGLGGVMFWELSLDSEDSALLNALYETLNED